MPVSGCQETIQQEGRFLYSGFSKDKKLLKYLPVHSLLHDEMGFQMQH
jgi:hypothetical protein